MEEIVNENPNDIAELQDHVRYWEERLGSHIISLDVVTASLLLLHKNISEKIIERMKITEHVNEPENEVARFHERLRMVNEVIWHLTCALTQLATCMQEENSRWSD